MSEQKTINREILKEMIDCVKREVKMRYVVYPKRVLNGTMTESEAEKEKKLMFLVQISLQKIYDGTAPKEVQATLFDTNQYKKVHIQTI